MPQLHVLPFCQHLREMPACAYFISVCARMCVLANNLVTTDVL